MALHEQLVEIPVPMGAAGLGQVGVQLFLVSATQGLGRRIAGIDGKSAGVEQGAVYLPVMGKAHHVPRGENRPHKGRHAEHRKQLPAQRDTQRGQAVGGRNKNRRRAPNQGGGQVFAAHPLAGAAVPQDESAHAQFDCTYEQRHQQAHAQAYSACQAKQ